MIGHRPTAPATGRRPRRRPPRGGFTLLEFLTAVMVVGTLGRIAVPNMHTLVLQARAQEVAGRIEVIHLAALDQRQARGEWPADDWAGSIPDGLAEHLPEGFRFRGEGYRLDWERWDLPEGLPGEPGPSRVVAVSVVTEDEGLGRALVELLDGTLPHYVLDDRFTFVLHR